MRDVDFDAGLDRYQTTLAEEAEEARERSWLVAARPGAARDRVPFVELRVGDFMTADDVRWVRVVELRGPSCNVKRRAENRKPAGGEVSVLFEIPEAVTVSGETRYWIERRLDEEVTIDRNARGDT